MGTARGAVVSSVSAVSSIASSAGGGWGRGAVGGRLEVSAGLGSVGSAALARQRSRRGSSRRPWGGGEIEGAWFELDWLFMERAAQART